MSPQQQQQGYRNAGWAVALVVGLLVFTAMSVSACAGIRQTLSLCPPPFWHTHTPAHAHHAFPPNSFVHTVEWRYSGAMGDRRVFGHAAPDTRAQYLAANGWRPAALWYAYTGEALRVAAGSTVLALAAGCAWLLLLLRCGALAALCAGHDALTGACALAALCALGDARTAVLGVAAAACAALLGLRRRAVRAALADEERRTGALAAATAPLAQRPRVLLVPLAAAALEAALQLGAFACWCHWVAGWRMWLPWLLALWLGDAVRLGAQGALADALAGAPVVRGVLRGAGAYARLALLWSPAALAGGAARGAARWLRECAPVAAWAARHTAPAAPVYVARCACDGAGARRAAQHLARASGTADASPAPVRACGTRAAAVLRGALLAAAAAACARLGVPARIAVWLCVSCSGAAALANTVPALLDALFVQRHVASFLA